MGIFVNIYDILRAFLLIYIIEQLIFKEKWYIEGYLVNSSDVNSDMSNYTLAAIGPIPQYKSSSLAKDCQYS